MTRAARSCWSGRSAPRDPGRRRLGARRRRDRGVSPRPTTAGRLRLPLPGPVRQRAPALRRRRRPRPQPELAARIGQADLLIVVGARLGETTSQRLHAARHSPADADASCTSIPTRRSWAGSTSPTLAINACPARLCRGAGAPCRRRRDPGPRRRRGAAASLSRLAGAEASPGASSWARSSDLASAARRRHHHQRRRQLRGLGHRFFRYRRFRHAARADLRLDGLRPAGGGGREATSPDRPVVCFAGDGYFLMTGQELATAVQYGQADGHRRQQRHLRHHPHAPGARLPGRVSGTDITSPDFSAFARAYGGSAKRSTGPQISPPPSPRRRLRRARL